MSRLPLGLACITLLGCSAASSRNAAPETCRDVQEAAIADTGARPANGTYTLYVGGDEAMPWTAYCDRMNLSSPRAFLTLEPDKNYSQLSDAHTFFQMSYRRVRIDELSLELDLTDDAFATEGGELDASAWLDASDLAGGPLPLAHAIRIPEPSGAEPGDRLRANARLDLADTAFELDEDVATALCKSSDGAGTDESTLEVDGAMKKLTLIADNSDRSKTSIVGPGCEDLGAGATLQLVYVGSP